MRCQAATGAQPLGAGGRGRAPAGGRPGPTQLAPARPSSWPGSRSVPGRGQATTLYGALGRDRPPRSAGTPAEARPAARAARPGGGAAAAHGAAPVGAGIHPTGTFGDVALVELERYRRAAGAMRGLMRRTPECALHVHVGMPDAESGGPGYNALRERMPLLQALAANSPFWFGVDSGLPAPAWPSPGPTRATASSGRSGTTPTGRRRRPAIPGRRRPAGRDVPWWALRLHPRHGTVEVRSLDTQSSLATSARSPPWCRRWRCGPSRSRSRRAVAAEALAQSSFRAGRDGLGATLLSGGGCGRFGSWRGRRGRRRAPSRASSALRRLSRVSSSSSSGAGAPIASAPPRKAAAPPASCGSRARDRRRGRLKPSRASSRRGGRRSPAGRGSG